MTGTLDLLVLVTAQGDDLLLQEAADVAMTAAVFDQKVAFAVLPPAAGATDELLAMLAETGVELPAVTGNLPALLAASRCVISLP